MTGVTQAGGMVTVVTTMVHAARAAITGMVIAGAIMAGGTNAILHVVRCRHRVIITATTDVRIMITAAGRIGVAAMMIAGAGMAITAINQRNKTKTGQRKLSRFLLSVAGEGVISTYLSADKG